MENLVSRLQESHAARPAMNNNEHIVISNSKQDSSHHTELTNVKLYVPILTNKKNYNIYNFIYPQG